MSSEKLTILFAGTPAFGLPALEALHASRHALKAVYTQPDRPVGRGQQIQFSPIKSWALAHQLPVFQPVNFKEQSARDQLAELKPDLLIVIAYGLILPASVLSIPRLGCVNVHASLLPAHRGASPIQTALLCGDLETGVSIMQMDVGMDTGPLFEEVKLNIQPSDTAGSLHDSLAQLGVASLLRVVDSLAEGKAIAKPQPEEGVSYTKKIQKEDAKIDWHQPAVEIERAIRAYFPWPGTFTFLQTLRVRLIAANVQASPSSTHQRPGEILAIQPTGILVATGQGVLSIQSLQFPGGKVLQVSDWYHARSPKLLVGQCFE